MLPVPDPGSEERMRRGNEAERSMLVRGREARRVDLRERDLELETDGVWEWGRPWMRVYARRAKGAENVLYDSASQQ